MQELPYSLRRVVELYEKEGIEALSPEEASQKLGVKKSTAKKYMDQLVKLGILEKTPEGKYRIVKREEPKKEEKEKIIVEEKPPERPEERPEAPPPVEAEVKPRGEVVEAFYFFVRGNPVPLRVSSIDQLAAVLRHRLIQPEELAYVIRTGFLQTWLERHLHDKELAQKLDELRGLPDPELYNEAVKIITEKAGHH